MTAIRNRIHQPLDAFFVFAQGFIQQANLAAGEGHIGLQGITNQGFNFLKVQDIAHAFRDDQVLEELLGNIGRLATSFMLLAGATIITVGGLVLLYDAVTVHDGSAAGAEKQAGQQESGMVAAGMVGAERVVLDVVLAQLLDRIPGIDINHRLNVAFDDLTAELQLPKVNAVREEIAKTVGGAVEMGLGEDLFQGYAPGAEHPGETAALVRFGVGNPAVDDVGSAITAGANSHGFALESAGRGAGHAAVILDHVMETALDVLGEILEEMLVGPIQDEFDQAPVHAFGDVVLDGMDDEAAVAEIRFKENGIIQIAGKAGIFPEDDTGLGRGVVKVVDQVLELGAPHSGGTWACAVAEYLEELEAIIPAPGADGGFLLLNGEVLLITAGIAQVGCNFGIGFKRDLAHKFARKQFFSEKP